MQTRVGYTRDATGHPVKPIKEEYGPAVAGGSAVPGGSLSFGASEAERHRASVRAYKARKRADRG